MGKGIRIEVVNGKAVASEGWKVSSCIVVGSLEKLVLEVEPAASGGDQPKSAGAKPAGGER